MDHLQIIRPSIPRLGSLRLIALITYIFSWQVSYATRDPHLKQELSRKFPENFGWCVATSAHQIEGQNVHSDWWDWEQQPNNIKNNDKSGAACDHWNRVREDIQLLTQLGVNQYRFSVEWAKIEPAEGSWNERALQHYQEEINQLQKNGIEPIITLQHFTLPMWLAKKGGWSNPESILAFKKYAEKVYTSIGQSVKLWITVNEPMLVLAAGYVKGIMPPGKQDLKSLVAPTRNMLLAHANAYHIMHEHARRENKKIKIGVANHITVYEPYMWFNPLDRYARHLIDEALNWTFLKAIKTGQLSMFFPLHFDIKETLSGVKGSQDFVGINYYAREFIKFSFSEPYLEIVAKSPESKLSDMNQEIHPEGLLQVLSKIHKKFPQSEIYITENGIDHRDTKRSQFLKDHLFYAHKAIKAGVPHEITVIGH